MNHDLIDYLDKRLDIHAGNLGVSLYNLGNSIGTTGTKINLSVKDLSEKIDKYSTASDKQANRMYWLTWALVGTGLLNLIVFVVQTIIQLKINP